MNLKNKIIVLSAPTRAKPVNHKRNVLAAKTPYIEMHLVNVYQDITKKNKNVLNANFLVNPANLNLNV